MTKRQSPNGDGPNAAWARLVAAAETAAPRARPVADHLRAEKQRPAKVDGRSLRKTGRTEQLNLRLRIGTKQEIRALAERQGCLISEIIEQAIAALKEKLGDTS